MKLLTIKPNVLQELFSYIKNERKLKIIKNNRNIRIIKRILLPCLIIDSLNLTNNGILSFLLYSFFSPIYIRCNFRK